MKRKKVTTPYCSGLSLLRAVGYPQRPVTLFSNHPLLFGTVSPTEARGSWSTLSPP